MQKEEKGLLSVVNMGLLEAERDVRWMTMQGLMDSFTHWFVCQAGGKQPED